MRYNPYLKFLGFLIKNGKKSKAKKILDNIFRALFYPSKRNKKVFKKLFLKLNIFIEVKIVKVRKRSYTVPFPIKFKRRFHIASKWLISSALKNKSKISFSRKLSQEISQVLRKKTSKTSKVLKLKKLVLSKAYSNRANAHFRW
jgi:ribosomal protein S7